MGSKADSCRLNKLETTLDAFVTRVDSRLGALLSQTTSSHVSEAPESPESVPTPPAQHQAPVLLIRDAAADIGIGSPEETTTSHVGADIISRGIVTASDVFDLLSLLVTTT